MPLPDYIDNDHHVAISDGTNQAADVESGRRVGGSLHNPSKRYGPL